MSLILLASAALAAFGVFRFRRIAAVGAAYKAKVLCSALFVSGRALDLERADEVSAEAYSLLRLFRARADRERREVSASFLGLWPRTAAFRPGYGATLALGPLKALPPAPAPVPAAPLPVDPPSPALERILDSAFSTADPRRRTRAILVLREGRIAAERYAPGFSASTPLPGWSMSKSVTGALIGILVGRKALALSDKGLLPEWTDERAAISLEDLLRMRSGLRFAEVYHDARSDAVRMLFASADTAGYAASRPLEAPPGSVWRYSSGTTNILSLVARRALGDAEYAAFPRRALFDPLGMTSAVFEPDASGTFVGSSFLHASARDWARFGELHRRGGVWGGRRVLPEGWAGFCAEPTPQSDGEYGAQWWLKLHPGLGGGSPAAAAVPGDAFHALGHEGQCLSVIPSRGLVVVRLGLSIALDAWDHAGFLAALMRTAG